ncbi:FAD-dependent oxidoreductase [Tenacibaculum piscium]|uniref:FAD-dependent oxidoreductase n=1 Tax=Tenacibaculum piscium TaxID=1458515 RepID=UPI001F2B4FC0|nr:NAD(P)/FAD-dependent oxidoreductase [Tenacibaculum piscium]
MNNFNLRICHQCKGEGKKPRRVNKRINKNNKTAFLEEKPKITYYKCKNCDGSGLIKIIKTDTSSIQNDENKNDKVTDNYPHIAIIGGGIGGIALAVACLHRKIPFTLYERDYNFDARSQGYGLTLQQASKAMESFGIFKLKKGVISTKHIVHTSDGKIIGEWGMRKWVSPTISKASKQTSKRTNIHIARQSLRFELLEQLGDTKAIKWGHQLIGFKENNHQNNDDKKNKAITLDFQVDGKIHNVTADIVVGADGIRSTVRRLLFENREQKNSPLRYLGCIVILGICPLDALNGLENSLLDSQTVFQTANGNERMYMMPYDSSSVMWQLSFPISEEKAKELSKKGAKALKEEACRRTPWHTPIPEILNATLEAQISGYPVYDRALLSLDFMKEAKEITLLGDAAHPMSPFKGQGANQALLDALLLARMISKKCGHFSKWRTLGIRETVLTDFETQMLARSASKVKGSADAVKILHSDTVLQQANQTRGSDLKDLK